MSKIQFTATLAMLPVPSRLNPGRPGDGSRTPTMPPVPLGFRIDRHRARQLV
jgi:hypothetical protein